MSTPAAVPVRAGSASVLNPLRDGPTLVVTAVGEAEGARGAAAALACAGADLDSPALFVDVGGRAPRPALLASAAAQRMEERLGAHLPEQRSAARGQICQLALPATVEGLDVASAAVNVARGSTAVLHVPPALLQTVLAEEFGLRPSGVLLRADLTEDRPLVALAARDLIAREFAVAVLKHRLSWVAERRALFGALSAGAPGSLPRRLIRRLGVLSRGTELRLPVSVQG